MTRTETRWYLAEPAANVSLFAEADGVWLRSAGIDLSISGNLRSRAAKTRLGRLLPTLVPQLIELGLAVAQNGAIGITHSDFATLETRGIDAFEGIVQWAPFTVELEAHGWLGGKDFRYDYRFYLGSQVMHLERIGCFVRRAGTIYRLDTQTFALLEAINSFNALPADMKAGPNAFIRFADVKNLTEGVGVQLDRYLAENRVLVPSKVGLDLIVEEEGRISFSPKIDGVPPDTLRQAFFASDDVEEIYTLEEPGGTRVRVVLDEAQREVLRRMQRTRHLGGADKVKVLRNPHAVFDGIAEAIDINLGDFGPRVKGVGDFPFVAQPYLQWGGTGIFEDTEGLADRAERKKFSAGIAVCYVDGSSEDVPLTSREEICALQQAAHNAWRNGQRIMDLHGKSVLVDECFIRALDELVERVLPTEPKPTEPSTTPRRFLLIYTNENELEYAEPERKIGEDGETGLVLPKALKAEVHLKGHQRIGIAWLQRMFRLGRHGCLLADDMGVGKTLQILTFLARLIEEGEFALGSKDPEAAPWDPILIVAPVTLLENETWLNDMRTFFEGDGAIFKPWCLLHESELKAMRRPNAAGKETLIGEPVLDLEKLRQYRVILTNYETVTNYQHSFARMNAHWSVVVTDEAQEYKTPSTKISHALKSLTPRFRIALTGTPVETRLLDVWNIFDFLQPGSLLGSAAEFTKKYEIPLQHETNGNGRIILSQLKECLRFGRSDAFVLRREKKTLGDLPNKHEHIIPCELSREQREMHLDILSRAHIAGDGNHPLGLIHQLMRVYQHPALVPQYEPLATAEAIARCPKLAAVLDQLHHIRASREKVLIFTRSLDMQQLLAAVIGAEFGLDVDIINGATSRRGETRSASRTRKGIVDRFRERPGFNVIVLSPDVAGIGLTLVEANHVIHYGRWWNPAKESQATDRVYRIGQTRDVHVYYPIAKEPERAFQTFDEKLDALIQRRRELANEFLTPMPTEDDLGKELIKDTFGKPGALERLSRPHRLSKEDIRRLSASRFEALVALLEERQGAQVILTPLAGDGGIDVIAVHGREIHLIQCKHTLWGAHIDANDIAEVISAFDGYRARRLNSLTKKSAIYPVLVTNGDFTNKARVQAKMTGIHLMAGTDLG